MLKTDYDLNNNNDDGNVGNPPFSPESDTKDPPELNTIDDFDNFPISKPGQGDSFEELEKLVQGYSFSSTNSSNWSTTATSAISLPAAKEFASLLSQVSAKIEDNKNADHALSLLSNQSALELNKNQQIFELNDAFNRVFKQANTLNKNAQNLEAAVIRYTQIFEKIKADTKSEAKYLNYNYHAAVMAFVSPISLCDYNIIYAFLQLAFRSQLNQTTIDQYKLPSNSFSSEIVFIHSKNSPITEAQEICLYELMQLGREIQTGLTEDLISYIDDKKTKKKRVKGNRLLFCFTTKELTENLLKDSRIINKFLEKKQKIYDELKRINGSNYLDTIDDVYLAFVFGVFYDVGNKELDIEIDKGQAEYLYRLAVRNPDLRHPGAARIIGELESNTYEDCKKNVYWENAVKLLNSAINDGGNPEAHLLIVKLYNIKIQYLEDEKKKAGQNINPRNNFNAWDVLPNLKSKRNIWLYKKEWPLVGFIRRELEEIAEKYKDEMDLSLSQSLSSSLSPPVSLSSSLVGASPDASLEQSSERKVSVDMGGAQVSDDRTRTSTRQELDDIELRDIRAIKDAFVELTNPNNTPADTKIYLEKFNEICVRLKNHENDAFYLSQYLDAIVKACFSKNVNYAEICRLLKTAFQLEIKGKKNEINTKNCFRVFLYLSELKISEDTQLILYSLILQGEKLQETLTQDKKFENEKDKKANGLERLTPEIIFCFQNKATVTYFLSDPTILAILKSVEKEFKGAVVKIEKANRIVSVYDAYLAFLAACLFDKGHKELEIEKDVIRANKLYELAGSNFKFGHSDAVRMMGEKELKSFEETYQNGHFESAIKCFESIADPEKLYPHPKAVMFLAKTYLSQYHHVKDSMPAYSEKEKKKNKKNEKENSKKLEEISKKLKRYFELGRKTLLFSVIKKIRKLEEDFLGNNGQQSVESLSEKLMLTSVYPTSTSTTTTSAEKKEDSSSKNDQQISDDQKPFFVRKKSNSSSQKTFLSRNKSNSDLTASTQDFDNEPPPPPEPSLNKGGGLMSKSGKKPPTLPTKQPSFSLTRRPSAPADPKENQPPEPSPDPPNPPPPNTTFIKLPLIGGPKLG